MAERNTKVGMVAASLAAACLLVPIGATAQEFAGWTYAATLYAWLPAMANQIDTPLGTVDTDKSSSDAIADLDFAFMGSFEARKGKWGLIGDLIYSDISLEQSTPFGLLYSDATVDTKTSMFSGYAAYRVYDTPAVAIDLAGGFRVVSLDVDLALAANRAPADRNFSESGTSVQPLVGARAIVPLGERWYATAYADYAGTGSGDNSWQLFSSLGYRFNDNWSAQVAYRYLELRKDMGDLDTTVDLYGPVIGATYHF